MNKVTVVASLLLAFGLSGPIDAAEQGARRHVKQWIPKKARTIAAHASTLYNGSPQFVPMSGTSISYATNTPEGVFNIGDDFYIYRQSFWLVSGDPIGPWIPATYVPEVLSVVVCSQLNFNPFDPYQLCSLPLTSALADAEWANWANTPEGDLSEYDQNRPIHLTGKVARIDWTYPRVFAYISVVDQQGKPTEWTLDMGSIQTLDSRGWTRKTLRTGKKIEIDGWQSKKRNTQASVKTVTLENGKTLNAASLQDVDKPLVASQTSSNK